MTTPLSIVGALGRMGRSICKLALAGETFHIDSLVEYDTHPDQGKNFQELTGLSTGDLVLEKSFSNTPGVVIDFSFPEATLTHIAHARKTEQAYVIGTTGFNPEEIVQLKDAARFCPVLLSPNMALGVNIQFETARFLTRLTKEHFDIEIVEAHHNQKKDAPSGTAQKIFEVIRDTLGWEEPVACHGREGLIGARPKREIGLHAIRGGDIVGEHKILYAGPGETLELTHRAQNREVFAHGSLVAAAFLAGRKPGYYDMRDVLGLPKYDE